MIAQRSESTHTQPSKHPKDEEVGWSDSASSSENEQHNVRPKGENKRATDSVESHEEQKVPLLEAKALQLLVQLEHHDGVDRHYEVDLHEGQSKGVENTHVAGWVKIEVDVRDRQR